jgi:uncharacterized membrane protein
LLSSTILFRNYNNFNIKLKIFFALLIVFFAVWTINGSTPFQVNVASTRHGSNQYEKLTLTATVSSKRIVFPGETILHKITLKEGNLPIPNATIGIYDPIAAMCIIERTDHNGEIMYNSLTSLNTNPAIYTFVFKFGNVQTTSTVAVGLVNVINLATYKVDAISTDVPSNRTLFVSKRTLDQPLSQDIPTTVKEASNFGVAVVNEILSKPVPAGIVLITALSCVSTPAFPPAGAACIAGLHYTAGALGMEIVKFHVKQIIEEDKVMNDEQKKNATLAVDATGAVISVAAFDIGSGLAVLEGLSLAWELGEISTTLIDGEKGKIKGLSSGAEIVGTNKVLQISCYFPVPIDNVNTTIDSQTNDPDGNNTTVPEHSSVPGQYEVPGQYSVPGGYTSPGGYTTPNGDNTTSGNTTQGGYTSPGGYSTSGGYSTDGYSKNKGGFFKKWRRKN